MKFGVITDCQYADRDKWDVAPERMYRLSPSKLKDAINFFNTQELEFVVHLGDLIDQRIENFDKPLAIIKNSKHKFYHVLGNHDFDTGDRVRYERFPLHKILDKLELQKNYYSFVVDEWRFIVLDTNEVGVIQGPNNSEKHKEGEALLEELKSAGAINALPWNGGVSDTQLSWLRVEIQESNKEKQSLVLLSHHQIFPNDKHQMLEPEKILKIISDEQAIKVSLSGHKHVGDEGMYEEVPCVTFKGMLDTQENSYAIVELDDKNMSIDGFGREKSRNIQLR